jgi:hypothetical protein
MKQDVPLSQNPYAAAQTALGQERLDNFYLEFSQSDSAKSQFYQVGRQGLRVVYPGTTGTPCRGIYTTSSNRTFAVHGVTVYEYASAAQARAPIGTLDTAAGTDPVYFRENGYQLFLVTGGYGYIFDLTSSAFSRILDEFFPGIDDPTAGPTHAAMIDTYFIANSQNTNRYYWSAPYYKPYAFDPLNPSVTNLWWGTFFGTKIGDTDNIVAMIEMNTSLLAVMGQNSMEFHRDTGNTSGQLMERIDVASVAVGCGAKHSLVKFGANIYWLGSDRTGVIGMFSCGPDFQPQRISTFGVQSRLETYSRIDDCTAFVFSADGHTFISWNFPNGSSVDDGPVTGATWIYDLTAAKWCRYSRWNAVDGLAYRWRAQFATYNKSWGMLLMGDATMDAVYLLDNEYYQDDQPQGGAIDLIAGEITSPITYSNGKNIRHMSAQLVMQQGSAIRNGQGSAPLIALACSNDSGFTFGYERWASMGLTGQYAYRTKWNRLGTCRNRVRRYRVTEPIKRVVLFETIEFEVLSR